MARASCFIMVDADRPGSAGNIEISTLKKSDCYHYSQYTTLSKYTPYPVGCQSSVSDIDY